MSELTLPQALARIAVLEAALLSVLDQPETVEEYDAMMRRVVDALGD